MTGAAPAMVGSPEELALVEAFRSATLPNDAFHHRDHLRVAWLYVRAYGFEQSVARFGADLRAFAAAKGMPGLYHSTITVAFLAILGQRLRRTPELSWAAFTAAHPDLLRWEPSVLDESYTPECLKSDEARAIFLLPDRIPSHSSHATA